MKNILTNIVKGLFKRRDWDPQTISGLGEWDLNAFEDGPAVFNHHSPRGVPHAALPLAERLKKVQADLEAFEEALPDLNKIQS